jgi:hypothetical protein
MTPRPGKLPLDKASTDAGLEPFPGQFRDDVIRSPETVNPGLEQMAADSGISASRR